jgi:hypothetical protein
MMRMKVSPGLIMPSSLRARSSTAVTPVRIEQELGAAARYPGAGVFGSLAR